MILSIQIDKIESSYCAMCNKIFYVKRPALFSVEKGWVNFCQQYCFERWLKVYQKDYEVVSQRELDWWVNNMRKHNEKKFAQSTTNTLAQWLNSKKTGSKIAHKVAQKSGSSLSLWGDEPLSHEPILPFELEPLSHK